MSLQTAETLHVNLTAFKKYWNKTAEEGPWQQRVYERRLKKAGLCSLVNKGGEGTAAYK